MKIRLIESPLAIPRYRQVRLPTVAAELTPYADVEINDENVEPVDFSEVDAVGFTAQVYNVCRAVHLSERFRAQGVKTILGGPHATAMPEWSLQHFDAVVVGEVEGLGQTIIQDLERGALSGLYKNPAPPDLSIQRLPRRDLLRADAYYRFNFPIELSRGCTHGCSFCFSSLQFPGFRTRPLDKIAEDLAQWDHGMIEVIDLHMAANRDHLIDCCELFRSAGVKGWFGECTLASLDDDDLLAALERSHCKAVFVGLESIDPLALQSVAKSFNPHQRYEQLIRKIQDHGIFVHAGLIWGLDGGTPESFERTLEFSEDVGLYLASTNLLAYYPGTRSHAAVERKGRLLTEDLRQFDSAHVVVEPDTMTTAEVYNNARRFADRFYSLGSIFRRSFQAPNYRFAQLADYWALNLVYRAYYKFWGRRLGATTPLLTPETRAEDPATLPLFGGVLPPIYALMDLSWRFWERWYAWWEAPPRPVSGLLTFLLLLLSAGASGAGLLAVSRASADRWPVPWPDPGSAALAFALASLVSFWLVHRVARSDGDDLLRLLGLALAQAPPLACALALPPHASLWRFGLVSLVLVAFMKGWSLIATGRPERKGLLRAFCFMFSFPTLDFAGSFRLERKKRQLIRHLPLQVWGFWKVAVGLLLFALLVYGTIQRWDRAAPEPVSWAARLVVAYACLSGLQDWLTAAWRMAGYVVPRGFERPFALSGLAATWRGWNVPMHDWLLRHVYVPLGGRDRPVSAVLTTFLVSGLLFEATLSVANLHVSGHVLLFFAVNGAAVAVDKVALEPRGGPGSPVALHWLSLVLSLALFLGTAGWLLGETDQVFQ